MVAVEPVAVFISRSSVWVAVLAVADDTVAIVSESLFCGRCFSVAVFWVAFWHVSPPVYYRALPPCVCELVLLVSSPEPHYSSIFALPLGGSLTAVQIRCMTARDRLRAWDVIFFGSSNLTHKSCGIFVASWGFAHCIGTRLVFHNFFIST